MHYSEGQVTFNPGSTLKLEGAGSSSSSYATANMYDLILQDSSLMCLNWYSENGGVLTFIGSPADATTLNAGVYSNPVVVYAFHDEP